jgi:hypothetical protein
MSHTNKFTRNARLRRFAPGSVPAENSAPPVFYGPPYAFREYLGGEGFIHPGPPPPPPSGPIAAQPPAPPAGRCSGYACGLGQEPGGGLLRQMGHVQFTPGRENRNRGLEAHRPVVFQFPKKVPKIPVALRASFQTQNNMTEEQRQRALAFDVTEYRAKMSALAAAEHIKAQGGSLEEQTLAYLATLSKTLQEAGMNEETRQIVLEFARKERNTQDPKKRKELADRRKKRVNKYTKKNNNNGYSGNSNGRTRKH